MKGWREEGVEEREGDGREGGGRMKCWGVRVRTGWPSLRVCLPSPQTDTFFAIMRLLLPELDRARPAYGMKETALAKHYIEVLNISKESTDAQKVLHYVCIQEWPYRYL